MLWNEKGGFKETKEVQKKNGDFVKQVMRM